MSKYLDIVPKELCTGCGACSAICPRTCISMGEDSYGFLIPIVNRDACVNCGLCEKACPVFNSGNLEDDHNPIAVMAARNKNGAIAQRSSSGGVFSAFAEYVLSKQGVVYGVALSSSLAAEHIRVDNLEDLDRIRSSKYLQSNCAPVYPLVKEDLISGKDVLFSGTPCQVAALKQFLRKDYPALLCIEVVCHGVPSNMAFCKYLESLQARKKSRVVNVNFRDKSKGWNDNCISFTFENGKRLIQRGADNLYTQGYVNNLFVRDSCTGCRFKSLRSGADITLGDMWGIESILPSYPVANGVSMICINSWVGESVFKSIEPQISDCQTVAYPEVKLRNACICRSVERHKKRTLFFENYDKGSVDQLIKICLDINAVTVICKKIRSLRQILRSNIIKVAKLILHSLKNGRIE